MWRQFIAEIAIAGAVVRAVTLPMTHDRTGGRIACPILAPGVG